jgi:hypothetical protein
VGPRAGLDDVEKRKFHGVGNGNEEKTQMKGKEKRNIFTQHTET